MNSYRFIGFETTNRLKERFTMVRGQHVRRAVRLMVVCAVGLMANGLIGNALVERIRAEVVEESVKVYGAVQASVVALENAEGHGTGIILDKTGRVLTNAHVVSSPLPFHCKADLRNGKNFETVTF